MSRKYDLYLERYKNDVQKGYLWLRKNLPNIFDEKLNNTLAHHGIKGQKWGVKNGPPYPLNGTVKGRVT